MESPASIVTRIYGRHAQPLMDTLRKIYRRMDLTTCEDVVAETFRVLFLEIQRGVDIDEDKVGGLLVFWAKRKAADCVRLANRQARLRQRVSRRTPLAPDPAKMQVDKETLERRGLALESALRDFTELCQLQGRYLDKAVFEARAALGWKTPQVAAYLCVAPNRVYSTFFNSRQWIILQLRTRYDPRGTIFASCYAQTLAPPNEHANISGPGLGPSDHVDQIRLQAFLDEAVPDGQLAPVEEHLEHCEDCRRLLESLRQMNAQAHDEVDMVRVALAGLCPSASRLAALASRQPMEPIQQAELLLHVVEGSCPRCGRLLLEEYSVRPEELRATAREAR